MNTRHIYFGAAYYDEYLPYDRIEQDMELMKKAGMNVIRIAESTWSTLEPCEGHYDFTHVDRMLDAALRHDISVIVGTPTYAIPAWLAKKAPDILTVTKDGPSLYGRRQNMDLTSPIYLSYAENIIRVLMEHVCAHPAVIGYQIDNETHHYETAGERVQRLFVESLKKQYPDICEFNHAFGLDYWSNRIDDWADFPDIRGTINASLAAEFERFQRRLAAEFHHWQAAIIEEYRKPGQFITHNFDFEWHGVSYGLQPDIDQLLAASCMDVAGGDIYHPSQGELTGAEISLCGNILRGLKDDNYLILETQAQGNPEWLPYPGQLRLCAYGHLANGANSVLYWHWHSIHNSFESYWKGVLSHDFSEGAVYEEACRLGKELSVIGDKLKNLKKENKIALLLDHASLTGFKYFPAGSLKDSGYNTIVRWIGDALYRLNLEYDVIFAHDEQLAEKLSAHELVFVPALYSAPEEVLEKLTRYTADGGTLVVTFRSGFCDDHLKIYSDTQPHQLSECLGIRYDRFTIPKEVGLSFHLPAKNNSRAVAKLGTAKVREWLELITPTTASSLADYVHPAWNGFSGVTENKYGKGKAYYLGCLFDEDALETLLTYIAAGAHIPVPEARFPIVLKTGTNDDNHRIYYYLNFSDRLRSVTHEGEGGTSLTEGLPVRAGEQLLLNAWDLKIICAN